MNPVKKKSEIHGPICYQYSWYSVEMKLCKKITVRNDRLVLQRSPKCNDPFYHPKIAPLIIVLNKPFHETVYYLFIDNIVTVKE